MTWALSSQATSVASAVGQLPGFDHDAGLLEDFSPDRDARVLVRFDDPARQVPLLTA
jgi:hypothetical protein